MKTRKIVIFKALFSITALVCLLFVSACKSDKDGAVDQNKNVTLQTNVKPPNVDIHSAVVTENKEALQQHIEAGTNLNEREPFGGSSPLISASVFGKPEMAKMLIEAGADLNFQNNEGSTALLTAAFFCRTDIVKMLLDKGADKNIRNKYGATALESVAGPFDEVKGAYDMMRTMLEPMGLKLDYAYLEKTRPVIAEMLKN